MEKLQGIPSLASRDADVCSWWNIKQAAAYLGVSIAFLRKSVRLRKIPFARIGSKSLRFRRTDLDRWVETQSCNGERNCAASGGGAQCPTC